MLISNQQLLKLLQMDSEKLGFYPLNRNIFEDHEFAPFSVTEQVQSGADASDQIFDIFTPVNATQEV